MSGALLRMLGVNVACMGGAMLFAFLNAYLLDKGLEKTQVGLCDGGFWLASVLLQPWLGPQLDKRGRILFLRAGVALLALSAVGYCFLPVKFAIILPLRILHGAGFALYLTAAWAWVADHAPPEKLHATFGIFGLSSLGGVVGPVLAERLRGHHAPHNDQVVFQTAVLVFSLALLVLFTLKDAQRSHESHETTQDSLWSLARRPRLRGTLIGSLSFGLAVGSLFAFVTPYLESLDVEVPPLFVVLTLVAGAGRALCGILSTRFGAAVLVAPCLMSLALGSAGLGALQWLPPPPPMGLMLLAGGVAGVGYGLVYPLLNGLSYERLQPSERGRGLSLVAACVDAGNAAGAGVAGVLAQYFGMGHMFLAIGGAVALTALISRWSDRS